MGTEAQFNPTMSCRFCGRYFNSPHAVRKGLHRNPEGKLPRRAPRSNACMICEDMLADWCPKDWADLKARDDYERLLVDEGEQAEHIDNLKRYHAHRIRSFEFLVCIPFVFCCF